MISLSRVRRYVSVIVIWALFVLTAAAGFVVGLALLAIGRTEFAERNFKAQNKAAATLLGFDGSASVSRECGRSDSVLCRWLCAALSWALDDPDHCRRG